MKGATILRWLLPFVGTGALLAYLLRRIQLRDALDAVTLESALVIVPVTLGYGCLSVWIDGVSLARLTRYAGRVADVATCARIKAASYALGLVNYAVGAAALAVLFRRRVGLGLAAAAGLVATVAITDLAMLILVTGTSTALFTTEAAALRTSVAVTTIAVVFGGLAVLRAPVPLGPLERLRHLDLFRTVRSAPVSLLAELALLRIAFVLTFIAMGAGCLLAFGVHIPPGPLVAGMASIALIGALPIAVAGLGTVQLATIGLFSAYADDATLFAASLAMQVAMILVRAAMALVFAREFTREAAQATRSEAEAPGT